LGDEGVSEDMSYAEPGKRVIVSELGHDPLEALEQHVHLEEQEAPDRASLGPRDVVVAIRSAAVGWVDLLMLSGLYQHVASPPYTPGLEYSGVVVAKGAEVSELELDDEVIADALKTGPRSLGDYQKQGGFASFAVAPADALIKKPPALSFEQACHVLSSYSTAYHCLITRGQLQAGEAVLIHGATGATGLAAVHIAKLLGATVIATGRSSEKLEQVGAQGADHLITIKRDSEGKNLPFRAEVKALTGGHGVDVVYDAIGGAVSLESLRCVRFGARFLIVGWASTPTVAQGKGERGAPRANLLPTNLIMMKGLDVLGCPAAISAHRDPALGEERRRRIFEWVAAGKLTPHVAKAFPLSEALEAMHAKWHSRHVGAIVLQSGA
jgi:NADPH2:quinone reductase